MKFSACPLCLYKLVADGNKLTCVGCRQWFPVRMGIPVFARNSDYKFSDFINRRTSILREISSARNLNQLFSIPVNKDLSFIRFNKNIASPSRAAFKYLLPLSAGTRVLDIGCGYGSITAEIAPSVRQVVAMDMDMDRLQFTRKRTVLSGIKNVDVILGTDYPHLPFADSVFDIIIINGVLEWVPRAGGSGSPESAQRLFLKEIRRVLKSDGTVYIGIENRTGYKYFLGSPDDHSHLLFGSLLPRFVADAYSRLLHRTPYLTWTYTLSGYYRLLGESGFNGYSLFFPSPNYKYPERFFSRELVHRHPYRPGQSLVQSLINDIRNKFFTADFLRLFSPSFSLIIGGINKPSFLHQIISRHFSIYKLESFQIDSEVAVKFNNSGHSYLLVLPFNAVNHAPRQPFPPVFKGRYLNQNYFIYNSSTENHAGFFRTVKYFRDLFNSAASGLRQSITGWTITLINSFQFLIPPDPALVLFGSQNGKFYGDNSKYLFEYVVKHRPQLRPLWLTASREVEKFLRERHLPVSRYTTLQGFWAVMRSPLALFTNSAKDLFFGADLLPPRLALIALRHGRSVKRVRFARAADKLTPQETASRKKENSLTLWAISTSPFVSEIQETCLRLGGEKHIVTGYPRTDHLVQPPSNTASNERVILYAPSWRHGRNPTRFFPFSDFDPAALVSFLNRTHSQLLIRPHINDTLKYPELQAFFHHLTSLTPRIVIADHHQIPDLYTILNSVDILITDYSAVYHDFLLLDRPIILIPYDLKEFGIQNGFLYDYIKFAPGPVVSSQTQLISQLQTRNPDKFRTRRRILRRLIYQHPDNLACSRVCRLIDWSLYAQNR